MKEHHDQHYLRHCCNHLGVSTGGRGWAWTCQALSRTMSCRAFRGRWRWQGLARHPRRREGSSQVSHRGDTVPGRKRGRRQAHRSRRCLLRSRWWGRRPLRISGRFIRTVTSSSQSACLVRTCHVEIILFWINLSFKLCQLTDSSLKPGPGLLAVVPRQLRLELLHHSVLLLHHQLQCMHLNSLTGLSTRTLHDSNTLSPINRRSASVPAGLGTLGLNDPLLSSPGTEQVQGDNFRI